MPIEFACEECTQLLRVPDGSYGQSCQCPACQAVVVIPDPQAVAQVDALRRDRTQEPVDSTRPDKLKIACPKCHFELNCPSSLLGTKGQCRNCQYIFTIARRDSATQPAAADASSPGHVFNCPACNQLFEGQAELEGRKGKCHACGQVFAIELRPAQAPMVTVAQERKLRAESSGARSIKQTARKQTASDAASPPHPSSSSPTPVTIQFECMHCQGVMEVPGSTAGRTTQCPFCQQQLTIPQQSTSVQASTASAGKYFAPYVQSQPQVFPESRVASSGRKTGSADLAETGGVDNSNPYATPNLDQYTPSHTTDDWSQSTTRKKIRGLTFGNAFELTFDSLFPYGLVAAGLFTGVCVLAFGFVIVAFMLGSFTVQRMQYDPTSIEGMTIIYGLLGMAVIVAVFLVTAVYCATCNTALHAVRKRPISGQVLFGTGESYGGMLVVMFGWVGFNYLRQFGVPWLVQSLTEAGQAETALVVGLVTFALLGAIQIALNILLAFVPYALLDGQSLPDAIATSSSIVFGNFLTVLAVLTCGALLYTAVSVLTLGVGFIVFVGGMMYLNAAVYHLASK